MIQDDNRRVVVAGHICVDIIPTFEERADGAVTTLVPGELVHIGPAVVATGGAASNTGLAMHRLGSPTTIIGKISDDLFGQAILNVLSSRDPSLTEGMVYTDDAPTSYTIVISPPGTDRSFLHCPGANDTFGPEDIDIEKLGGVCLFHFGYPPLMQRMYADGGYELTEMLKKVHDAGIVTSLDLAHIDMGSEAGQIDWRKLLTMALKEVDLFVPSLDEVYPVLQPARFQAATENPGNSFMDSVDTTLLRELADELIEMGAAIVCLKMGEQGIYLRTTKNPERLTMITELSFSDEWLGREQLAPAFAVEMVGTTGAGDCAIAGFLSGIVRGQTPEQSLTSAVAAGSSNVEQADALSGIPSWGELQQRIRHGWDKIPVSLDMQDWRYSDTNELWIGPSDPAYSDPTYNV